MQAEDIEALISVGRPTISRDGSFAVFATSRPSAAANRNVGRLHRVELDERSIRPLTRGIADSSPRLSPDDTRLGFLRPDAADRAQLWVVEASGGEPVQVTDAPLGVQSFAWSPDGTHLAYLAAAPEHGRYGTVEGLSAAAEAPRLITGTRWNYNGVGWTIDRPSHIFLIGAPDLSAEPMLPLAARADADTTAQPPRVAGEPRQLTASGCTHSRLAFSRDGTEVLTLPTEPQPVMADLRSRLIAVRIDGSGERELIGRDAGLAITEIAVAEDGAIALLAATLSKGPIDFVAANDALWLLSDAGLRRLTDPETIDLGEVGSHITPIGEDFLVQNRHRGTVELLRVARTGDIVAAHDRTPELSGEIEVGGHDASATGRIVAAVSTPTSFGELVEAGVGQLSDLGTTSRGSGVVVPESRTVSARDDYPIHGWVATPAGEGPFPVILQIHGGPYAQYGVHVFDETQVLANAGYAVVYCNPRGSAGYGQQHGRSIRGAMGTVDMHDVLDFLDGALKGDPRLDSARVGIMGGSYGGYLTAWIIAHDHRFAGAIVERGFLDPASFQGTSDIGSFFGDEYVGTTAADIARQSPMTVVEQVRTPTLVIHSELDYRCPLEQATRYYAALRRAGTEAQMLVFPGENHELTRSGQPRHRLERFTAVLDWWRLRLPDNGA